MQLGAPLAFFLGGSPVVGTAPKIVNLIPAADATNVKLLRPIRLSVRDTESYVDPSSIKVAAGYAKVYSNGDALFEVLPNTSRRSLLISTNVEPDISLASGVRIENLSGDYERGTYVTNIDTSGECRSVIVSAVLKPELNPTAVGANGPLNASVFPGPLLPLPFSSGGDSLYSAGAVLGLENGPRNKAIYVWFQHQFGGAKIIRITSWFPDTAVDAPPINEEISYDWTDTQRYTILWDEATGNFELYANAASGDRILFRRSLASIPEMPSEYFAKVGEPSLMSAIYGLEGIEGDVLTISKFVFTTDVGFPVLGNIRPGDFVTYVKGSELLRVTGASDPRDADVAAWVTTPSNVMNTLDPQAASAATAGVFRMEKPTLGKTFSIYREEPGLGNSDAEGFLVEARMYATGYRTDGAATGMGFIVFDGQTVFQLQMFDNAGATTVGLLKKNGSDNDITEHFLPDTSLSWEEGHLFRLVVDSRRGVVRLYDGDDLGNSVLDIPFSRSSFPSASDYGWDTLDPFIAVGHIVPISATGTFGLVDIGFCHLFHAWDTEDAVLPTAADPAFTRSSVGSPTAALTSDGDFEIDAPAGSTDMYYRDADFEANRGAILEARVKVTSWRRYTRTGTYLMLDDGLRTFALTFVENSTGRFVALSQRTDLGGFRELVGRDGDSAKISFLLDWTQYHTYRMERHPYDGLKVFVDDDLEPRIVFPESKLAELPEEQFSGTPTLAFGQFSSEGAVSRWEYVRGFFSRGYEVSFKKNKPDKVLKTELFKTQAIIIANVQDMDV